MVLIPLKYTISLCGGVARKFSLVKIPSLRHCFPIFSMVKKKFLAKGGSWPIWPRGKYATVFGNIYPRNSCLLSEIVQSWLFWLGTHFWVCFTFCRVRHNVNNNNNFFFWYTFKFNSIQAFIDAAYMHGQRRLTISSKSKSALILVSVRTINLVEKKSFKFFPETRRVSGCTQLLRNVKLNTKINSAPYIQV